MTFYGILMVVVGGGEVWAEFWKSENGRYFCKRNNRQYHQEMDITIRFGVLNRSRMIDFLIIIESVITGKK